MDKKFNKILEYFDNNFFEEKVEIYRDGTMGTHYDGLNFDYYLSESIYSIDYLSIEDYFESFANITYNEQESIYSQYSELSFESRLLVVGAILTLINISTYRKELSKEITQKTLNYLNRLGIKIQEDNSIFVISTEIKLFEGSYCDIFTYNNQFYKKQLKNSFRSHESWIKRFKYEYENMIKLSDSPYVLKVFNYEKTTNSYLMEICDCNLYDYLKKNPFMSDEKLINLTFELIKGILDVHNAGIIHRDLHLGNILIKNNNIILSDFGLSKDTMIIHSLKSSTTPKNSHYFMDPIGLSDFTKLDKLSDIYSIGKIIDYITKDSALNQKLSYVINKASDRDRTKRYLSVRDMESDLKSILIELSEEEHIKIIEKKISEGVNSPKVEDFILKLSRENQLAKYIVKKKLFNFWKLLKEFNDTNQALLLSNIEENYSEATGYGGFENYDLFANIMFNYIKNSSNMKLQRIAYWILEGCAQYRFNSKDRLDEINIYYPNLNKINEE